MATAPMTDPTADDAGAADDSQGAGSGGYTIEIKVDGQGAITVGVESGAEEDSEEYGGQGADGDGEAPNDGAKSVPDKKTALQVVSDIMDNAGQMRDASTDEQAGFDSVAQ